MNLPVNKYPTYQLELPASKTKIKYRPWTSLENKKLLTALITKNKDDIQNAIVEILQGCTFNQQEIKDLPMVDVEYLFTQVKSKSKGEIIELTYHATTEKDGIEEVISLELDLSKIEVTPIPEKNIKISDSVGLVMKLPSYALSQKIDSLEDDFEKLSYFVEYIYDEKKIFTLGTDFSLEELKEWLENLTEKQLDLLLVFTSHIPTIKTTLEFSLNTNPPRNKIIELEGLSDFFL